MDKAPEAFRIISEVASELDVPQHVLRFWESRFAQIRPMKRGGGRRYYRPDDIDLLRGIRHLLYSEGYTIRGVQRLLREQGIGFVQGAWQNGVGPEILDPDGESDVGATNVPVGNGRVLHIHPGFHPAGDTQNGETEADIEFEAEETADEPIGDIENGNHWHASKAPPVPRSAAPAPALLGREQLLQLRTALDELGECRRLIDGVLQPAGEA